MSDVDMLLAATTALWLSVIACLSAGLLLGEARHSILVLMLVHSFFCGVPLWLDLLFGRPEYAFFPGFHVATRDSRVNTIYCLYVSAVPVLWWWFGRARRDAAEGTDASAGELIPATWQSRRVRLAALVGMLTPLLAVLAAPEPASYLHYGAVSSRSGEFALSPIAREHHMWVSLATQVAVVSGAVFLSSWNPLSLTHLVLLAPFLGAAAWVNGKRLLVAYALLLVGYVLWRRRVLPRGGILVTSIVALVAFVGFSAEYQRQLRGYSVHAQGWAEYLEGVRVDYGRDHVIKLAIHAELEPETVRILDHRGQSLVFYSTMLVPRVWYPDKPYPYAQYHTSAALMVSPRLHGWGVTTSILDEGIANFGWLGLLIGPLVVALVCRVGDATRHATLAAITVLVATLLMTVELVAFAPMAACWALATSWLHWTRLRDRRRASSPSACAR